MLLMGSWMMTMVMVLLYLMGTILMMVSMVRRLRRRMMMHCTRSTLLVRGEIITLAVIYSKRIIQWIRGLWMVLWAMMTSA